MNDIISNGVYTPPQSQYVYTHSQLPSAAVFMPTLYQTPSQLPFQTPPTKQYWLIWTSVELYYLKWDMQVKFHDSILNFDKVMPVFKSFNFLTNHTRQYVRSAL